MATDFCKLEDYRILTSRYNYLNEDEIKNKVNKICELIEKKIININIQDMIIFIKNFYENPNNLHDSFHLQIIKLYVNNYNLTVKEIKKLLKILPSIKLLECVKQNNNIIDIRLHYKFIIKQLIIKNNYNIKSYEHILALMPKNDFFDIIYLSDKFTTIRYIMEYFLKNKFSDDTILNNTDAIRLMRFFNTNLSGFILKNFIFNKDELNEIIFTINGFNYDYIANTENYIFTLFNESEIVEFSKVMRLSDIKNYIFLLCKNFTNMRDYILSNPSVLFDVVSDKFSFDIHVKLLYMYTGIKNYPDTYDYSQFLQIFRGETHIICSMTFIKILQFFISKNIDEKLLLNIIETINKNSKYLDDIDNQQFIKLIDMFINYINDERELFKMIYAINTRVPFSEITTKNKLTYSNLAFNINIHDTWQDINCALNNINSIYDKFKFIINLKIKNRNTIKQIISNFPLLNSNEYIDGYVFRLKILDIFGLPELNEIEELLDLFPDIIHKKYILNHFSKMCPNHNKYLLDLAIKIFDTNEENIHDEYIKIDNYINFESSFKDKYINKQYITRELVYDFISNSDNYPEDTKNIIIQEIQNTYINNVYHYIPKFIKTNTIINENAVINENTVINKNNVCMICYTNKYDTCLLCGHVLCETCYETIMKNSKKCHICRRIITGKIKLFI
ncbi:hypothetical protein Hokovirus_1_30 [Hokovirus HKV1]|uniref:RING-type domain-containing protein n=1 Tax=Hokovirus HKV1 TaxID=1977638 RepID=A0A1V0SEP7_9VIRU|nr:hypothetical protein Hokovirus_1_30 [Hokovirus HKV1]